MIRLHAHDVVNFQRCRRKDYYSRVRGWEVPTVGRKAEIGSMFHAALAITYSPRAGEGWMTGINEYTAQQAEKHVLIRQEDIDLAGDMTQFYLDNFAVHDDIAEVLSVEQEIEITHFQGFTITCRPDLIFRDSTEVVHLRDHKTKDALPSDYSWFDMDPQMMLYQLAARSKGWTPCKVEHNLVRREVPPGFGHRLEYNEGIDKNGKAWRRKSTASTEPNDYVRPYTFQKNDSTLDAYELELAKDLLAMATEDGTRRSPSTLCTYCPYFIPCSRELAGETVSDAEAANIFSLLTT